MIYESFGLHLDPPICQVTIKWWFSTLQRAVNVLCAPDILVETCHRAHIGVQVEVDNSLTRDHSKSCPADILLPNCGSVGRKHLANDPKCSELGCVCVPMVAESYGAWGEEASAIITSIASRLATSTGKPKLVVLNDIYGRLNVHSGKCWAHSSITACLETKNAGRHYRHSAINDIIHRALVAAHVPSRLEPSGLYRSDGKRPDGIPTVPWKCGQLLVWDATCPDTYAPSYSTIAAQQAGAVGQQAEDKKAQKYKHLSSHHFFTPVAIETSGVYGPRTADFLKELGHRLRQVSGEASSFHYLAQRLSVAIQRGNSASVMGTMDGDGEEFFV
ncbi:hypothetical protein EMCRGX_G033573 [Ephydatia muelleri]